MSKLLRILISLWKIEQLERRVAVLEGELTLRVAKLEADAATIEYNRARAGRLLREEPRAKRNEDLRLKRLESTMEALTEDLELARFVQECKRTPFWSGPNHRLRP